mgnify:FL=1
MNEEKYLLEEITYSNKENSRIIEAVLKLWLKNPKNLNYMSPSSAYPFQFKRWVKQFYFPEIEKIKTIIVKHKDWIIGHGSIRVDNKLAQIFHIFIDEKFRRKGLASLLVKELEKVSKTEAKTFTINVVQKNIEAKMLYEKLGYKIINDLRTNWIKMEKST